MNTTKQSPPSNNPKLQKAVIDSSKQSDLHFLEIASQDIKALEDFMISKAITDTYLCYCLKSNLEKAEYIEWSYDESSGKRCLNYAIYNIPDCDDKNKFHANAFDEIETKMPLNEAPSNIQLFVAGILPALFKHFAGRFEECEKSSVPAS